MEKSRKVTYGEAFDKEKTLSLSSLAATDGEGPHNCNAGLLAPGSASFVDAALWWRKLIPTAMVGSLAVFAARDDAVLVQSPLVKPFITFATTLVNFA